MWHHDATRPHRELGKASQWLAAVGGGGALPGQVYWVVPGLLMLCLGIGRVGRPELWRDELLTWSALTRPLPDFVRMLGGIDAVLGLLGEYVGRTDSAARGRPAYLVESDAVPFR